MNCKGKNLKIKDYCKPCLRAYERETYKKRTSPYNSEKEKEEIVLHNKLATIKW